MTIKILRRLAITLVVFFTLMTLCFSGCKKSEPKVEPVPETDNTETQVTPQPDSDSGDTAQTPDTEEQPKEIKKPVVPESLGANEGQEPVLKVYTVDDGQTIEMPFEQYVAGVVGGEVMNDWPEEVLKTQAIIARTFVMKTIQEGNGSKYDEYAHVSTDIEEAQAWDTESVNDAIKQAVEATKGMVISYEGEFIYAWFHSNAGGVTALADEGLNFEEGNPLYVHSVESPDDNPAIPEDEKNWSVTFDKAAVVSAAKAQGIEITDFSEINIAEQGPSGRVTTLMINDQTISAPELRIALGSSELKSTLIGSITVDGGSVTFKGTGYGHGVGVSQWGAYQMAEEGKTAEEIITYYFKDVDISKVYE
jgi:stage II sporulation protein D